MIFSSIRIVVRGAVRAVCCDSTTAPRRTGQQAKKVKVKVVRGEKKPPDSLAVFSGISGAYVRSHPSRSASGLRCPKKVKIKLGGHGEKGMARQKG
jgi:hypothetical protein